MTLYTEQTTDELIALLFQEEDRVTLEHIQVLAARPDAMEPLRAILRNEQYWDEGQHGEYWIEMHAVTILSLAQDEAAIPDLLRAIDFAHRYDMDWLTETMAGHLARFGSVILRPLMEEIGQSRDKYQEGFEYSFARAEAATTLLRIAHEHPEVKAEIVTFLCDLLLDPAENDPTFNALLGDQLVYLNREEAIVALQAAFARDAVDEIVTGDFDQFLEGIDMFREMRMEELSADPLAFYQPENIAARQKRWQKEAAEEARELVAGPGPAFLARRLAVGGDDDDEWGHALRKPTAPEGYNQTESGTVLRTEHTGRNEPCPCGSGKKFKKCCGK